MIKLVFGKRVSPQKTVINGFHDCSEEDRKHIWLDSKGKPNILGRWINDYFFCPLDRDFYERGSFPYTKANAGYQITLEQVD